MSNASARQSCAIVRPTQAPLQQRVASRQIACSAAKLDKSTSDDDWKKILSPEEFTILRKKGTVRG